jgi:hypothetical protein
VGGHADAVSDLAAILDQPGEAAGIGDEAALARLGRGAAEIGMGVEDRQQRQRDARLRRRFADRLGEDRRLGVARAVGGVVDDNGIRRRG